MDIIMKITTARFGEIEVVQENVITFNRGILGFGELHKFILFPADETQETPFYFLQSVEEGEVCFFLLDTFSFYPEYDFELDEDSVSDLNIERPEDVLTFTIVTAKESLKDATTNLKAPVIINNNQKLAKQVVLEKGNYLIKQPLFDTEATPELKVNKG